MTKTFSRFFHLPFELRQHVFRSYFSSSSLVYPYFYAPPILLSSRQLYNEAKPLYWQNTHFEFPGTKQLLDFLTGIDYTTLTQLRHISVHGYPLPVYPNPDNPNSPPYYTTYFFEYILPLFPGLQLSMLRIQDPWHGRGVDEDPWGHDAAYSSIKTFIQSQGFKELTYIVTHDRFMKPTILRCIDDGITSIEISERHPQPSTWDAMIKARDGATPGAGVKMYRVLDDGNRRLPLETEFERVHTMSEEENLRLSEEQNEGIIEVTIRRRMDADHVQRGEHISEYSQRLSRLFQELTWKQILEKGLYVDPEDDATAHL
ncbi:MAG: hypothetical protein L6R41_000284 [Letrouitia leprolyta]|nr:MAG: hypothetical protein L6R41_000284 [Letrouitia leprolyta]